MEANLNLEGCIAIFLVELEVGLGDKRNLLVRGLGTENISERNILEALGLSNIIIIGARVVQELGVR